ncbi:MAG: SRPBCC family protein [bacterium]
MTSMPDAPTPAPPTPPRKGSSLAIKIVGGLAVVLVLGVVVLFVIGLSMPVNHEAHATIQLNQPIGTVWGDMLNVEAYPSWREPKLKSVKKEAPMNGHLTWTEDWGSGEPPVTLEATAESSMSQWEVTIHDPSHTYTGAWTFDLAPSPDGAGSLLTITERGSVPNPVIRAMFSMSTGADYYLKMWLQSLAKKYGETPNWVTEST